MSDHGFSSCDFYKRSSSGTLPSGYISDEDLFADFLTMDDDEPYLSEPPAPPRAAEVWLAQPLLPPVVEPRRRSSADQRKLKSVFKARRSSSPKG